MPAGMLRRRFYNNWLNCSGDGRRPGNFRGYLHADDDEYVLNEFCILCRLESEVRWLIEVCGISHKWQSLRLFPDFNSDLRLLAFKLLLVYILFCNGWFVLSIFWDF